MNSAELQEIESLLEEALDAGITLYAKEGKLAFRQKNDFSEALKHRIIAKKPQLLAYFQQHNEMDKRDHSFDIPKARDAQCMPLSYAQEGLWFIEQLQGSRQYYMPAEFQLRGNVSVNALKEAVRLVIQRHDSLRCTFHADSASQGKPYVKTAREVVTPFEYCDVSHLESEKTTYIHSKLAEFYARPFDLSKDSLVRVLLISDNLHHWLAFNMHHIVSDGASMSNLVAEIEHCYGALHNEQPVSLPQLTCQYGDYAHWQKTHLNDAYFAPHLAYFKRILQDKSPLQSLPADKPRSAQQTTQGTRFIQTLPSSLSKALKVLAAEQQNSLFMWLMSTFMLFIARINQQSSVLIGTPVLGRDHSQLEKLIGLFVNTLVVEAEVDQNVTFAHWQSAQKTRILEALEYSTLPFDRVVELAAQGRDLSHHPVVQILFSLTQGQDASLRLPGLEVIEAEPEDNESVAVKCDLELHVQQLNDTLVLNWKYDRNLYERATIAQWAKSFEVLLAGIVAAPHTLVGQVPLLDETQKRAMLAQPQCQHIQWPQQDNLVSLFERQVDKFASRVALTDTDRTLSYQALDQQVNKLAAVLQAQGVYSEQLVPVSLSRGVDMIVTLLAILKVGGAYVPIDPSYPVERIEYIVSDVGARLLVCDAQTKAQFAHFAVDLLTVEEALNSQRYASVKPFQHVTIHPQQLAYIIYTSGTTGKPKGVQIEHRHVVRLLHPTPSLFDFNEHDVWTMFHSFCFDFSVWEMYGALLFGGKLVIVKQDVYKDTAAFAQLLLSEQVTVLNQTPSAFYVLQTCMLSIQAERDIAPAVRYVIFGGEALQPSKLKAWHEMLPSCQLINMYGITETTVHVTFKHLCHEDLALGVSNIGKPIPTTSCYVLDKHKQLLPQGAIGELYVGGEGVGRGYWQRPALNDSRFFEVSLSSQHRERVYRSGDLVRLLPSGEMTYVGRLDEQVKVRGYRIELGEIENQLRLHPKINEAIVLLDHTAPQGATIEAFVTEYANAQFQDLASELKTFLTLTLPDFMLPRSVTSVAEIPLTNNGKVDKKQLLLLLEKRDQSSQYEAPNSEIEQRVAYAFEQVLQCEQAGRHSDFFNLGGHSLLAVELVNFLQTHDQFTVSLKEVFQFPSVAALSVQIEKSMTQNQEMLIPRSNDQRCAPLSFGQQRLWALDAIENQGQTTALYHVPLLFELEGSLNQAAFEQAWFAVLQHHTILRTVYRQSAQSDVEQHVLSMETMPITFVDVSDKCDAEVELTWRKLQRDDSQRAFDLHNDLMLRIYLLKASSNHFKLLINIHHIACDAHSLRLIVRDVTHAYAALCETMSSNDVLASAPDTVSYIDYANWQRTQLQGQALEQHRHFWHAQLSDAPVVHQLPLDSARIRQAPSLGGLYVQRFDKPLHTQITGQCQHLGVSMFMWLHSLFSLAVARFSNTHDVVIGSPFSGRMTCQLNDVAGFFVNTLPIRMRFDEQCSIQALMAQQKEVILAIHEHQAMPFEHIVDVLQPPRDLSHHSLFQISFAFNPIEETTLNLVDLQVKAIEAEQVSAKFELDVTCSETADGLALNWIYNRSLFNSKTVTRLAQAFETLVLGALASPDAKASRLPMMADWQGAILQGRRSVSQPDDIISQIMAHQATPELWQRTALIESDGRKISYQALDNASQQLAQALLTAGVSERDTVLICLPAGVDWVVTMFSVMRIGACYVPIDPSYPEERIRYIAADCGCQCVVTYTLFADILAQLPTHSAPLILLDNIKFPAQSSCAILPHRQLEKTQPAYVIYTSGTTGQPKGVIVPHQGLSNLCQWHQRAFAVDKNSVATQTASVAFDAATWEVWPYLCAGATLTFVPKGTLSDAQALSAYMDKFAVTHSFLATPIAMAVMADSAFSPRDLHYLLVGGDKLNAIDVERFNFNVVNNYGPTETSVVATSGVVNNTSSVPDIGKPIDNTQLLLLDKQGQLQPLGAIGELCIAGAGVALGYLNREQLSEQRFIHWQAPSGEVIRAYRSGDMVRELGHGRLAYLGRNDEQVKLRGYRIELDEIAAQIKQLNSIEECTVLLCNNANERQQLVAFLVPMKTADSQSCTHSVAGHLQSVLPSYMLPSHYIALEALPLTAHGKVNNRALQEQFETQQVSAKLDELPEQSAATPLQDGLLGLYREVLNRPSLTVHCDFFACGGDSILSIQIVSRARALGCELNVADIFAFPSVAKLSEHVAALQPKTREHCESLPCEGVLSPLPAQQWFLAHTFEVPEHWNQAVMVSVNKATEVTDIQRAMMHLINHHDSLRLVVEPQSHSLMFSTDIDITQVIEVVDMRDIADWRAQWLVQCEAAQQSLRFDGSPLLRGVLAITPAEEEMNRLMVVAHHLLVDGVSWRVLLEDLASSLQACVGKSAMPKRRVQANLQKIAAHFCDYARHGAEISAWTECVAAANQQQFITSPSIDTADVVARSQLTLPSEQTQALLTCANQPYNTRIQTLLLAALQLAVMTQYQQQSQVVMMEGHGRTLLQDEVKGSETVGWMTAMYPLHLYVNSSAVEDVICAIKEALHCVQSHSDEYGILRYMHPDEAQRQALHIDTKKLIFFNYLGQLDTVIRQQGGIGDAAECCGALINAQNHCFYAMQLTAAISSGVLTINIDFDTATVSGADARAFKHALASAIETVIAHCSGLSKRWYTASDFRLLSPCSTRQLNHLMTRYQAEQVTDVYPLSHLQQGMWFQSQLDQDHAHPYLEQSKMIFSGYFDSEAFVYAWQQVMAQHSILRTAFNTLDGEPVQLVLENCELPIEISAYQAIPVSEQKDYLETVADQEYQLGIALDNAPCMKLRLLPMADAHWGFVWTYHHMIMDGWSLPVLFNDLLCFYNARIEGRGMTMELDNYVDFIQYIHHHPEPKQAQFWQAYLQDAGRPTLIGEYLQTGVAPEDVMYQEQTLQLPKALCAQINGLTAKLGVTANQVIQSVFGYWLSVCCQSSYALFGQTIAGRPAALRNMENRVGAYINTQAVWIAIDLEMSAQDFLLACKDNFAALSHYPQSALSDAHKMSPIDTNSDLFDVLYVFENFPQSPLGAQADAPFEVVYRSERDQTHYPLTLVVSGSEQVSLTACYQTSVLLREQAKHCLAVLAQLIDAVCQAPQQPLRALSLLLPHECTVDKSLPIPTVKLGLTNEKITSSTQHHHAIPAVFSDIVRRYEQEDAVVFFDGHQGGPIQKLSYGALDRQSDQLAIWLQSQFKGENTQPIVGICIAPSVELVVAIMAVLKAGAAYLPLTTALPEKRKSLIVNDANVALILADSAVWQTEQVTCQTYQLKDIEYEMIDTQVELAMPSPSQLCYVIYTSGTTGTPKGVMVEQQSVLNYVGFLSNEYGITNRDNYLQFASFSFDVFAEELFCSLLNGATLVLSDQTSLLDMQQLSDLSYRADLTLMSLPTAFWHQLSSVALDLNPHLRIITIGGEQMQVAALRKWQAQQGERIRLINAYGPTEATISTTLQDVTSFKGDEVAIGRAVAGIKLHILDANLKPLPKYIPGELYVSGIALARGYLGDEQRTAQAFITDPDTGIRLYKTGDRVKLNEQDELVYLGRQDGQVKVRGYRIELAEVERHLLALDGIQQCAAVVRQDASEHAQLVAFVELENESTAISAWRAQLTSRLPSYMIPQQWVVVSSLPHTPNGKLDRKALVVQAQQFETQPTQYRAPSSVLETGLARQFAALLKVERVGLDDDFFLLGGHSLLVMRLVASIEAQLNLTIPLAKVIQHSNVGALAQYIEQQRQAVRESETATRTLMCLQDGEAGFRPVVLIAGAGGMLMAFQRLVEELDPRIPVYGLQPDEIAYESEVVGSVEKTAEHYLAAIHMLPSVHLVTHSFGSFIGYEMTKKAKLRQISSLTILDTPLPSAPANQMSDAQISQFILENLCEFFQLTPRQTEIDHYIQMAESTKLVILASWLSQVGVYFSQAQLGRFYQTYRAQLLAQVTLDAPLPEVPVTVIKAAKTAKFEGREVKLDMGWQRVVRDIKAFEVDGDHLSILRNQEEVKHLVVEIESNYILHK
ncbi:amino acid adenylation domain-containing protein [Pseudoalteromonas sp. SMS1]|uniref:non-ribosomal peptide synthetase n=1 Tax=Pseudoalteromonas sp. SMS1 TaxID=2908894 RepID=UPI001F19BBD7|nr:non-ribosomal peptide synthetase [Pseudoalteromonas sp. SMS1]MCF2859655.1 amino acid adenylation domain-containing protein [Pseudoalteromonas sp. SMS1]